MTTAARANRHTAAANIGATLLGELLDAATEFIENWCHRTFASTVHAEVYDGQGDSILIADNLPITDVASVVILWNDDTTTTIDNTGEDEFRYDPQTGIIKFSPNTTADYAYFPKGFQNITLNYTAGFATIPESVQEACIEVALAFYKMGSSDKNPAFESEKLGDYSYKVRKDAADGGGLLTPTTRQTLAAYKIQGKNF